MNVSICDALITIQQNKENRKNKTKKKGGEAMPEKIVKQTLSEQIYNILKEDILCGRI